MQTGNLENVKITRMLNTIGLGTFLNVSFVSKDPFNSYSNVVLKMPKTEIKLATLIKV